MIVFITKMDPDRGQITGRLDDEKLQNWVTMSHDNEEAKRSFLQVFITVMLQSWWLQSCCGCCVCNPLPPHLCLPQRNSVHVFHEFESRLKFHKGRVSPTSAANIKRIKSSFIRSRNTECYTGVGPVLVLVDPLQKQTPWPWTLRLRAELSTKCWQSRGSKKQ